MQDVQRLWVERRGVSAVRTIGLTVGIAAAALVTLAAIVAATKQSCPFSLTTKTKFDLWTLDMETRKATLFLRTEFNEQQGQFSPDGRWMAYISDESRSFQVYVRSFPLSGGKWQVSVAGGTEPRWRRDGKELYFITPDKKVMAVPVRLGATFEAGAPKELFAWRIALPIVVVLGHNYAVTGDGQRFLISSSIADARQDPITVVVNWK